MKKIRIVKKILARGYPVSSRKYRESHAEADNAEKRRYPRAYRELGKIEKHLSKNELLGTHDKKGDILISKKVPRRDREDLILHEEVERKADARLKKKKR